MIRFLLFLLGRTGYESCKSCETLKAQLAIANHEKDLMTNTLLDILRPKVMEAPVREVVPAQVPAGLWSRRKQILEEQDRQAARTLRQSPFAAKPDDEVKKEVEQPNPTEDASISKLEQELGVASNG